MGPSIRPAPARLQHKSTVCPALPAPEHPSPPGLVPNQVLSGTLYHNPSTLGWEAPDVHPLKPFGTGAAEGCQGAQSVPLQTPSSTHSPLVRRQSRLQS